MVFKKATEVFDEQIKKNEQILDMSKKITELECAGYYFCLRIIDRIIEQRLIGSLPKANMIIEIMHEYYKQFGVDYGEKMKELNRQKS